MSDELAEARKRAAQLPPGYIELWEKVAGIIKRDGNPNDPSASVPGAANEVIELCRRYFNGE